MVYRSNKRVLSGEPTFSYTACLEHVQEALATNTRFAEEVSGGEVTKDNVCSTINKYLMENGIVCDSLSGGELVNRLYRDMIEYGVLTDLLERKDIEEIDVNAYDDIDIYYRDGRVEKITDGFLSPKDGQNIVQRLLRAQSHTVLDNGKPIANAHLNNNVRICAVGGRVVDDNVGIACSIRFIGEAQQNEGRLQEYGTASSDMLLFLKSCVSYGVSVCFGGATGAGKTSTAGWLLSTVANKQRVITCEEESREINLVRRDENGKRINSVVQFKTVPSEDENASITLDDLLRTVLRFDPDVILVSEMRSKEAYVGQEASRTGHTVLTTTHCNSARAAYTRMLTLALEARTELTDERLLRLIVEAFPIVVYQKKLRDGSRKITQIVEGLGVKDGEVDCRVLWQYEISEVKEHDNGEVTVTGEFVQKNGISDALKDRFVENGLPTNVLSRFLLKEGGKA